MTTWRNYKMFLVITVSDLGKVGNTPVIVFDQEDDAKDYINQLNAKSNEFIGNYPCNMWRVIPIKVSLNSEHFHRSVGHE